MNHGDLDSRTVDMLYTYKYKYIIYNIFVLDCFCGLRFGFCLWTMLNVLPCFTFLNSFFVDKALLDLFAIIEKHKS